MSDYFQLQDNSITSINFLRYSENEWDKIAGNQLANCNRLRASDYLNVFRKAGFDICRYETKEDEEAKQNLMDGFEVDLIFDNYKLDDLPTTQLKVALKVAAKEDQCV